MRAIYLLGAALLALSAMLSSTEASAYQCNDRHYLNVDGNLVHSPSCGQEPDHKTAECRDGSVSHSEHHSGTCSHHGGVAHWD